MTTTVLKCGSPPHRFFDDLGVGEMFQLANAKGETGLLYLKVGINNVVNMMSGHIGALQPGERVVPIESVVIQVTYRQ